MKLELSGEQYERLLELAFAGNWMLNGWREPGCLLNEYEDLCRHLFSCSGAFMAQEMVERDESLKEYFLATPYERKMLAYIDQYDEHVFHEELIVRLIRKELDEFGETLTVYEKVEIEEKYMTAVGKHGIHQLSACLK